MCATIVLCQVWLSSVLVIDVNITSNRANIAYFIQKYTFLYIKNKLLILSVLMAKIV